MLIPIILSGGIGSRLWPLSRVSYPKPFLKLPDGDTLLNKTFLRVCSIGHIEEVITITNHDYFSKSKPTYEQTIPLSAASPPKQSFLLEPFSRNTASAIALAVLKVKDTYGPEATIYVFPADHLIEDNLAFVTACQTAFLLAQENYVVTFGINPTHPNTSFGYIECGERTTGGFKVKRFVEKPSLELATQFLASKQFLWNAGIFCFKAGIILEEYKEHAPTLLSQAKKCWDKSFNIKNVNNVYNLDPATFRKMENISIDYALLEKSKRTAVVPCYFRWCDVGSWEAFKELYSADENGNAVAGDTILIDSQNTFIHSENRIIAGLGLKNLIVVDTPDALLISARERVQDVKSIVETLKANDHECYYTHRTIQQPWGMYTILEQVDKFKIKRVVVHTGAAVASEFHQHHSKHWVILQGVAKIKNGEHEFIAKTNASIFIPKKNLHSVTNIGKNDLIFIEVQIGDYLGEDDIKKFEDLDE